MGIQGIPWESRESWESHGNPGNPGNLVRIPEIPRESHGNPGNLRNPGIRNPPFPPWSIHSATSGGDTHFTTLTEWSKTFPNNPIIVEFALQNIFRLFTKHYFPNDLLITNKSKLIEETLEKFASGNIYCHNDCGGNGIRGICEPTKYFKFGICKCKPDWTGSDCSVAESPKIVHGTICGFDRSFMRVNCGGFRPWESCPKGWSQHVWPTDLTICYKDKTVVDYPVHGTLCGLHSSQSASPQFTYDIGCNITTNSASDACPLGYRRYTEHMIVDLRLNSICAVVDAIEHVSGTLCGMQIENTIKGPSCNGFDPGLGQCPPEYALQRTAFNYDTFMVCVKK